MKLKKSRQITARLWPGNYCWPATTAAANVRVLYPLGVSTYAMNQTMATMKVNGSTGQP